MNKMIFRVTAQIVLTIAISSFSITAMAQQDAPAAEPPTAIAPQPAQRPLRLAWSGHAYAVGGIPEDAGPLFFSGFSGQAYSIGGVPSEPDKTFVIFRFVDDDHLQLVEFRRTLGNIAPRTAEALRIKFQRPPGSNGPNDGVFDLVTDRYQYDMGSKGFTFNNCTDEELTGPVLNFCNSGFATKSFIYPSHRREIDERRVDKLTETLFDSDTSAKLLAYQAQLDQLAAQQKEKHRQDLKDAADARKAKCAEAGLGDQKSVIVKAQALDNVVAMRCKAASIDQFPMNSKTAIYCQTRGCSPFKGGNQIPGDPFSDLNQCEAVELQKGFEMNYFQRQKQMNPTYTPMMYIAIGGGACPPLP